MNNEEVEIAGGSSDVVLYHGVVDWKFWEYDDESRGVIDEDVGGWRPSRTWTINT